jgi:hypothetical protein
MRAHLFLSLVCVTSFGTATLACAGSTAPSPEADEGELRVGASRSESGLRLGVYAGRSPENGEFTALTLKSRVRGVSREFDGTFSGKIKESHGTRDVKGGFKIVQKRVPAPQLASHSRIAKVLKLVEDGGPTSEFIYQYIDNTLVLSDVVGDREQFVDLVTDAAGNRTFSLSCKLTELHDDNVFEEGLSKEEYPDISIDEVEGKFHVDIGAAMFDGSDDDRITVNSRSGDDIKLTIALHGEDTYRVSVKDKKGVIENLDSGSASRVADFKCD